MSVLAFDQATLRTGYALFEKDYLAEYGLINLATKEMKQYNSDIRCRVMVQKICGVIKDKAPDIVVIEDVALQKNAKVLIQLSRIQGSIIGYCDANHIAVSIMKPTQWRKLCGISQGGKIRSELKDESQNFVKENFNLMVKEDEADAICIGYPAWREMTVETGLETKLKEGKEYD